MGKSAKITRGGNKHRVNAVRQEKKAEEARQKAQEASRKLKKRVRIEVNEGVGDTLVASVRPNGTALASRKQVIANSVRRLEEERKQRSSAVKMLPTAGGAPQGTHVEGQAPQAAQTQ